MSATRAQTGDVTIPAIVVEAVGTDGWVSIEWHLRRRRAAAWREIHGRVRDGIGPGEET